MSRKRPPIRPTREDRDLQAKDWQASFAAPREVTPWGAGGDGPKGPARGPSQTNPGRDGGADATLRAKRAAPNRGDVQTQGYGQTKGSRRSSAARHGGGGGDQFARRTPADQVLLYGYHPVREALRSAHRTVTRVFATEAAAERLAAELKARDLVPTIVEADAIAARLGPDSVHQGVLAEAKPIEPMDLGDLPAEGLVLVLDQVTDPHNVGAILRTAAAFGVNALITTERHSPAFTGVLAKSASGGLEHVGLISVVNLARTLEQLADMGYLRVGLDSEGPASLEDTPLSRPLALVLGAEGKGLRRLTRENCDVLARLDMPGAIKSLNVSNACAVALTLVRAALK